MADFVLMPQKGLREESAILSEWHVKKGDVVKPSDILFDIETGKATFPVECEVSGIVLETIGEPGDEIHIQECVCVIGKEGETYTIPKRIDAEAPAAEAAPEKAPAAAPVQAAAASKPVQGKPAGRIFASPIVRKLAKEKGIDLANISGTGPGGRIIRADFEAYIKSRLVQPCTAASAGETCAYEDKKFSQIRKVTARTMFSSIQTMAQLTNSYSFDATEIIAFHKKAKESMDILGLTKISYNDIILYVVSRVLLHHPDLNANMIGDDTIRYFKDVNLGMAVDTPRGLLVPTIFGANHMSLNEISLQAKSLAAQAKAGTIAPELLQGASFTVTNVGSLGVESFTPIINPPQTGILGVCNMQTKLKMKDGQAVPYQAMGLSLTYDHRAVDGSPASRFAQEVCKCLENFSVMLAK